MITQSFKILNGEYVQTISGDNNTEEETDEPF